MRILALALLAVVLALPGTAFAEGPGSFARYKGYYGGAIRLEANYVARDTCQAAIDARRGAPPGQAVAPLTIPVTIVIGPNPRGCGQSRLVQRVMTVGGPTSTELIQIFFVNPTGRILKIEKISISTF
ncbi:hypothetical protein [Microbaculum marinisediminis]|uniref:Uncharacterized protein n=1 Tax=Microbaculum marinisediminis TaxID=2931392 RepID=A0AAW5QYT7_9HYPH|nr:hypothetical protein [Microbaculum sp. A6E488]MCT8973226.1 hypothetical protein [Microbaculum sp. A6E488]